MRKILRLALAVMFLVSGLSMVTACEAASQAAIKLQRLAPGTRIAIIRDVRAELLMRSIGIHPGRSATVVVSFPIRSYAAVVAMFRNGCYVKTTIIETVRMNEMLGYRPKEGPSV